MKAVGPGIRFKARKSGKPRRITKRPEQIAHVAVVAYLQKVLPAKSVVWHTPNSAKRGHAERTWLRKMGLLPGFPDIAILYQGRLFLAEMKAPGGDVTDNQETCIGTLEICGATFLGVWQSIDDCELACVNNGIPLKTDWRSRRVAA